MLPIQREDAPLASGQANDSTLWWPVRKWEGGGGLLIEDIHLYRFSCILVDIFRLLWKLCSKKTCTDRLVKGLTVLPFQDIKALSS